MISMISHCYSFLETLCFVINTTWANRIYIAPVVLVLRMYRGSPYTSLVDATNIVAPLAAARPRQLCVPSDPTLSV